ncbi:MAG: tetratricopeptide repeat protein [Planctomycetes bacterium]|nr:tetratricopeptide repeat protein [Planctomycetota bacterium]
MISREWINTTGRLLLLVMSVAFFACLPLRAEEGGVVGHEAPDEAVKLFGEGMKLFDAGEFKAAYEVFFKAFAIDPASIDGNFYMGRAAFESGDYESAIMAYDRILMIKPDLERVKLELARSYYKLGNYETSKEMFKDIMDKEPPNPVKEKIRLFLDAIESTKKKNFFSGSFSLGLHYDDNVRVSPADDHVGTLFGDVILGDNSKQTGDEYWTSTLVLNHKYKFADSLFAWKTTGVSYTSLYFDENDLDLLYFSGMTGPSLETDRFVWDIKFHYTELHQDYNLYLQALGASNSWTFVLNRNVILSIGAKVENKEYHENRNKDANNLVFGGGPIFIFGKNRISTRLELESENAQSGIYSYDKFRCSLRYDRILPKGFMAYASYKFQMSDYQDIDPLFGVDRMDDVRDYSVGISKKFTSHLSAEINHTYTESESNIDLYNYNRSVSGFTMTWDF